jgi:hypothetical protein
MIRDILLSAKSGDDEYYEPPTHVLSMAVIGGDAHLAIYEHDAKESGGEAVTSIEVSARSLLLALTALVDDNHRDTNTHPARD